MLGTTVLQQPVSPWAHCCCEKVENPPSLSCQQSCRIQYGCTMNDFLWQLLNICYDPSFIRRITLVIKISTDTECSNRSWHIRRKCVRLWCWSQSVCVKSLHSDYTDHTSEAAAFKAAEETFLLNKLSFTHRSQRGTGRFTDWLLCVLQAIIDQECVMHRKSYNTQKESREFPLSDYSEEEETEEWHTSVHVVEPVLPSSSDFLPSHSQNRADIERCRHLNPTGTPNMSLILHLNRVQALLVPAVKVPFIFPINKVTWLTDGSTSNSQRYKHGWNYQRVPWLHLQNVA